MFLPESLWWTFLPLGLNGQFSLDWTPGSVWVFWSRGGRDPVPSVLEWNFSLWSKLLSSPAWVQLTELIRESEEERKETILINNQCSRHHLALSSEDKWM